MTFPAYSHCQLVTCKLCLRNEASPNCTLESFVRRDREAMLDVLRYIEEKLIFSGTGEPFPFRGEGYQALRDRYSEEEINYALYLLIDAKLVEGGPRVNMHSGSKSARVLAITNLGHDYLERAHSAEGKSPTTGTDAQ